MASQFVLFGSQHLISIASIFLISVLFPLVIKGLNIKSVTKTVLLILGITLIAHELIGNDGLTLAHSLEASKDFNQNL